MFAPNMYGGYSLEWVPIIYVLSTTKNQRTNGPVNAHLISGPSMSTKIQNFDKMAEKTLTLLLIILN